MAISALVGGDPSSVVFVGGGASTPVVISTDGYTTAQVALVAREDRTAVVKPE